MKIQILGSHMKLKEVTEKLIDVIYETVQKLEKEQEIKINGFGIVDSEFTVKLNIDGIPEPQVVTVEHHKGQPEMFKWIVNLDKDESNSNEEESEFDQYSVAKANGMEMDFHETESLYEESKLQNIDTLEENYGTMSKKILEHADGFRVVQIYQHDKLIQEYKLTPKGDVS